MKKIIEQPSNLSCKIHPLSIINKIFYMEKGGFEETEEEGREEKEDQMQLPYERIPICTIFLFFFLLLCPSSGNSAIVRFQRLKHGKIRTLAQKDPFFHFQGFAFKNNSLAKIPQKSLYCCMYISSRSPQCPDILLGIKETHFL